MRPRHSSFEVLQHHAHVALVDAPCGTVAILTQRHAHVGNALHTYLGEHYCRLLLDMSNRMTSLNIVPLLSSQSQRVGILKNPELCIQCSSLDV